MEKRKRPVEYRNIRVWAKTMAVVDAWNADATQTRLIDRAVRWLDLMPEEVKSLLLSGADPEAVWRTWSSLAPSVRQALRDDLLEEQAALAHIQGHKKKKDARSLRAENE